MMNDCIIHKRVSLNSSPALFMSFRRWNEPAPPIAHLVIVRTHEATPTRPLYCGFGCCRIGCCGPRSDRTVPRPKEGYSTLAKTGSSFGVSAHRQSGIHGRDVSLVTEARVRRQPFALALSGNQSFPVTSRITRMIRRSPPGP